MSLRGERVYFSSQFKVTVHHGLGIILSKLWETKGSVKAECTHAGDQLLSLLLLKVIFAIT